MCCEPRRVLLRQRTALVDRLLGNAQHPRPPQTPRPRTTSTPLGPRVRPPRSQAGRIDSTCGPHILRSRATQRFCSIPASALTSTKARPQSRRPHQPYSPRLLAPPRNDQRDLGHLQLVGSPRSQRDVLCRSSASKALLDECFRVAGRTTWYLEPDEIRPDLDRFLAYYNLERSHQGYRLKGRTPAQALREALGITDRRRSWRRRRKLRRPRRRNHRRAGCRMATVLEHPDQARRRCDSDRLLAPPNESSSHSDSTCELLPSS